MKITLKISIAILAFALICGKGKDKFNLTSKVVEQSVSKISDSLYAGKYEVSNQLYRLFVDDLKKNNKLEDLKIANVDTLNWSTGLWICQPYAEYYFRHPAYNNYPVVNITYDGAVLFCKWLTEKYNANPKRKFKKIIFRLPNTKEWEKVASGGIVLAPYPWGTKYLRNSNGQFLCNFKTIGEENISQDTISKKIIIQDSKDTFGDFKSVDITAPVKSYWSNSFGLHNMSGNVAEMVKEKGVAKGGGWKSYGYDVRIDSEMKYTKSQIDIGFRYFMHILEK